MDTMTPQKPDAMAPSPVVLASHKGERSLADAREVVISFIVAKLTQPQFDALCLLVANTGAAPFVNSKLRDRVNQFEYRSAAALFLVFDEYEGGLARRIAERNLFLEGTV